MKFILEAISKEILEKILEVRTCVSYAGGREVFEAPVVFLEITNYTSGSDPATEELALIANIEARVVVDSTIEDAEAICQALACEIANIAHLNSFGCEISPAKVTGITRDFFKPDFDMYVCWLVEWTHEFHVGDSVWFENGVPPHFITIGEHIDE